MRVGDLRGIAWGFAAGVLVTACQLSRVVPPDASLTRAPEPFEDIGACPFEGCVYRDWTVKETVGLHAEPNDSSAVVVTVRPGDLIFAITGIVRTLHPGVVVFDDTITIATATDSLHLVRGDSLFLLTYHGEGASAAWFRGTLFDWVDGTAFLMDGGPGQKSRGKVVVGPVTEWWVRIRTARGIRGWTRETDKFGNTDRYGV